MRSGNLLLFLIFLWVIFTRQKKSWILDAFCNFCCCRSMESLDRFSLPYIYDLNCFILFSYHEKLYEFNVFHSLKLKVTMVGKIIVFFNLSYHVFCSCKVKKSVHTFYHHIIKFTSSLNSMVFDNLC